MFGLRPLMTRYEFCLICADCYALKGDKKMYEAYRMRMKNMTIEEARRPI